MLQQARTIPTRQAVPPTAVARQGFDSPLDMMGTQMRFGRNAEVYGEDEPAEYLYKVVSGAVRT